MSTAELQAAFMADVEIQKRNPFNSKASTEARERNQPRAAEMARRQELNGGEPNWRKWTK